MTQKFRSLLVTLVAGIALLSFSSAATALDERAAKKLFKSNDCTKCHATSKSKKGPSLKKIAKENKDKPDVEAKMIKHMTSSPVVKLDDGTEEEHKMIDTEDEAELKNLVEWIMSH